MNVPADIKQRVENKVKDCMDKASKYYNRTFDMPTIRYNLRGTTAGEAWYSYWMVKFQPGLLMDNLEYFIESTVPHEVAHLIDHVVNPENFQSDLTYDSRGRLRRTKRTVHGADFKFIMTHVLGAIDDTRYFNEMIMPTGMSRPIEDLTAHHLFEWEKQWILKHPERYRGPIHQQHVISVIEKRYMFRQITEMVVEVQRLIADNQDPSDVLIQIRQLVREYC